MMDNHSTSEKTAIVESMVKSSLSVTKKSWQKPRIIDMAYQKTRSGGSANDDGTGSS